MRVFIGIGMPDAMKSYLKEVQSQVLSRASSARPTSHNNMHLTLKFIGEVDGQTLSILCEGLEDALQNSDVFDIKLGDLGHFNKGRQSIVWVGITEGKIHLQKLHQAIQICLNRQSIQTEKQAFHPHVTLARGVIMHDDVKTIDLPFNDQTMTVDKVTIYKSHRVHDVLTYTPLYDIYLK